MSLVPAAIAEMVRLMDESDSDAVRIRAVENILDRAGLKVAEEHVLIPQEATNAGLDAAIAAALAARGHAVPAGDQGSDPSDGHQDAGDDDVVDAEVVDNGTD